MAFRLVCVTVFIWLHIGCLLLFQVITDIVSPSPAVDLDFCFRLEKHFDLCAVNLVIPHVYSIFTTLRALHAAWSSHEKAVWPYICPSNAWIVTKLKFVTRRMVGGDDLLYLKF